MEKESITAKNKELAEIRRALEAAQLVPAK
jgi:hypothetical protein